ncbi:MAG: hypothetical protein V4543_08780 [Bacteroidota bacterium]
MEDREEQRPEAILHALILKKIASEWPKWRRLGHGATFSGINSLPSKRAFYVDLQIEIRKVLAAKLSSAQAAALMPSDNTLRRFLEDNNRRSLRKATLSALCLYSGYDSYAAFMAAHAHLTQAHHLALVHIRHVHRQERAGTGLVRLSERLNQSTAGEERFFEDAQVIKIKPWYRNTLFLLTLIAVLLGVTGLAVYKTMQVQSMKHVAAGNKIPFSSIIINAVSMPDSIKAFTRNIYNYDFTALGIDTLEMQFERSIQPRRIILTEKKGSFQLFPLATSSKIILSAKGEQGYIAMPIGGRSGWHWEASDFKEKYNNLQDAAVSFNPIYHHELVRNGFTLLPDTSLPVEIRDDFISQLSSFGYFPKTDLNSFSLEFRYKCIDTLLHIHDMRVVLFNRYDIAFDYQFCSDQTNILDYVFFGERIIIPQNELGSLEVKDSYAWNVIRLDVADGQAKLYCNNELRVSGPCVTLYPEKPKNNELWGIEFSNNSTYAIDYLRIKGPGGKLIYAQEFSDPLTLNETDSTGKFFSITRKSTAGQ